MTGSISRKLFQHLLFLYPKLFRDEFGKEMLEVFEQCERSEGCWRLLADVVPSAVRQRIHYRSILVPKSAPFYPEIGMSLNLARTMAVAALSASLIAIAFLPTNREHTQLWTVVHPEALFWFPIIPEARSCSEIPEHISEPERIFTTGVLIRENAAGRQSWTFVRGKTGFWISTLPWGQYCLNASSDTKKQKRFSATSGNIARAAPRGAEKQTMCSRS